jgi:glycolate oxidase
MVSDRIQKLVDHFGDRAILDDATLEEYSHDYTEVLDVVPDAVIYAESVEDVQYVVRFANEYNVGVTPVSGRTNGGGLAVPYRGGVILDLSRMNKIHVIDEDKRYCVVEPGVTYGKLLEELERRGLCVSIPRSPVSKASVIGNLLITGYGHMAAKTGFQSDLVTGLEVVLGSGECVKLGSASLTKSWMSRQPLPDLCGLVLGWGGATGIVTKAGISIFKKPEYSDLVCFGAKGKFDRSLFQLLMRLLDLDMIDELTCCTWGHPYLDIELCDPERRDTAPDMFFNLRLSATTKSMIDCKVNAVIDHIKMEHDRNKSIDLIDLSKEQKESFATIPLPESKRIATLAEEKALGVTNPTAILPLVNMIDILPKVEVVLQRYGIPLMFFLNTFKGSRLCSFMVHILFDKEGGIITSLLKEIVETFIESEGVTWKAPPSIWALEQKHMDGGALQTVAKIKQLLDPKGIMHPGQLNLPPTARC